MWSAARLPEGVFVGNGPSSRVEATYSGLLRCFGVPDEARFTDSDGENEYEFSWKIKFIKDDEEVYGQIFGIFNRIPCGSKLWGVYGDAKAGSLVKQFLEGL